MLGPLFRQPVENLGYFYPTSGHTDPVIQPFPTASWLLSKEKINWSDAYIC